MPRTSLNLSPEQRAASLEKARQARRERSQMLDRVRAGTLTLEDVLGPGFANDTTVQGTPLRTLLIAIPGISARAADEMIHKTGIAKGRRVRGLGSRQREALLNWRK